MDQDLAKIREALARIESALDETRGAVRQMRRYFLWSVVIAVAVIILPLLALPLVLPSFLQSVAIPAGL